MKATRFQRECAGMGYVQNKVEYIKKTAIQSGISAVFCKVPKNKNRQEKAYAAGARYITLNRIFFKSVGCGVFVKLKRKKFSLYGAVFGA